MRRSGTPAISAGSSLRDARMVCDFCGRDGGLLDRFHGWDDWWTGEAVTQFACPAEACRAALVRREREARYGQ